MSGQSVAARLAAGGHWGPVLVATTSVLMSVGELLSFPGLSGPTVFAAHAGSMVAFSIMTFCHIKAACRRCDRWTPASRPLSSDRVWAMWAMHRMVPIVGMVLFLVISMALSGGSLPLSLTYLSWLWVALTFQLTVVHKQSTPWCPFCPSIDESAPRGYSHCPEKQ